MTSYIECTFATTFCPNLKHSCVLKSTFCLARSIGLASKKVLVKWDPKSREIWKGYSRKKKKQVRKSDWGIVKSSHLRCELLEACSLEQTQRRVVDRTWILTHASKSSHLRCELFTIPQWQSDFRTCCFLFPWVPFPNFSISRLLGPILLKLSSMVNLSNERDRKLISVRTSAWHLGKRFSKVTICIRRHERNSEISWSLIGHKTTVLRICAQSEART